MKIRPCVHSTCLQDSFAFCVFIDFDGYSSSSLLFPKRHVIKMVNVWNFYVFSSFACCVIIIIIVVGDSINNPQNIHLLCAARLLYKQHMPPPCIDCLSHFHYNSRVIFRKKKLGKTKKIHHTTPPKPCHLLPL